MNSKDLFDDVVFAEEHIYQKAILDGVSQGKELGIQQGYEFGTQQGDLVGKELGQMRGFVETITSFLKNSSMEQEESNSILRLKKSLQQMQELLEQFPKTKEQLMDTNAIPINEQFEQLKNQFKLLHIRLKHCFKKENSTSQQQQEQQNNSSLDF